MRRKVAEVARLLGISDQTIYVWRRQHLIDTGQLPGTNSSDLSELAAARKRIAELEAELAVHRRAAELRNPRRKAVAAAQPTCLRRGADDDRLQPHQDGCPSPRRSW
ncbi:transposase [Streptomyces sp. NPDC001634]|uniref:transposase n=1 Tax=Streptomyces sp. NPDC001634 TaxID=3154390 RepID=UPI0033345850